ncbi:MAG: hypothetical protein ABSD44_11815 [Terracidiphilus sp.]
MQADSGQLPPYFMLIVPTISVGIFCLVSFLSSVLSGWHKLSKRFRAQSEPYGATNSAGPFPYTVYTRYWSHYNCIIRMTAAGDALYLSVIFLLRIGHPSLCIPWREIQFSRTKYFWRSYVVLTLGERERIPMRIPMRMAQKLGILDRLPV